MGDSSGSGGFLILIPFALAAMAILAVVQFATGKKMSDAEQDGWGFYLTWGLFALLVVFFIVRDRQ